MHVQMEQTDEYESYFISRSCFYSLSALRGLGLSPSDFTATASTVCLSVHLYPIGLWQITVFRSALSISVYIPAGIPSSPTPSPGLVAFILVFRDITG